MAEKGIPLKRKSVGEKPVNGKSLKDKTSKRKNQYRGQPEEGKLVKGMIKTSDKEINGLGYKGTPVEGKMSKKENNLRIGQMRRKTRKVENSMREN